MTRTWLKIANRLIPHARHDEFFKIKPKLSHIRANFKAYRDFKKLNPDELKYLIIFGLARGGTNLICSRIHYHKSFFCVSEQEDPKTKITFRLFLLRSIYGSLGLQDKQIAQLKWLVYNKVDVPGDSWDSVGVNSGKSKYLFYLRNPLRVIISKDGYARKNDRPEWIYSNSSFKQTIEEALNLIKTYNKAVEINRSVVKLTLHEQFCRNWQKELKSLFGFIDSSISPVIDEDAWKEFFKEMYCCDTKPVYKDGWLRCLSCGRFLWGYGNFNPTVPISLDRTLSEDIRSFFKESDLDYFRKVFTPRLANFWINDKDHMYEHDFPEDILQDLKFLPD
ncbi:MAG: hypothetical protein JW912_08175 [Sedimentisphaerales bacterium]|nr:hypothetical protein [Sedimentisphaerales bacterium]